MRREVRPTRAEPARGAKPVKEEESNVRVRSAVVFLVRKVIQQQVSRKK